MSTTEQHNIPETVMATCCAGCAFRHDTEASTDLWTVALRDLCLMLGHTFMCHDLGEGHVCRGWLDAFTVKLRRGDYGAMPQWKYELARRLIDLLHDMRERAERGEAVPDDALSKVMAEVMAAQDPAVRV